MSARIPPGWAEVWVQITISSDPEPMYTAFGVDLAAGVSATQAVADELLLTSWNTLDNIVSADFQGGLGHVVFGNDGGDIRIDGSGSQSNGLAPASSLPNNCAYLVRKLTASGGRRNRGRMFIPGVPEGNVIANGEITSAWRTTVQTALSNFYASIFGLANVDDLVLFHDSAPFTPTVITDLVLQNKIATQRRRMRR